MLRWPQGYKQLVHTPFSNQTYSKLSILSKRSLCLPDFGGKLSKHIKAAVKNLEVSIISWHHELVHCVIC